MAPQPASPSVVKSPTLACESSVSPTLEEDDGSHEPATNASAGVKGARRTVGWRERDEKSKKNGSHAPVYFTDGSIYTGEWKNNLRDGRGTYRTETHVYEGAWRENKRCGYGTLTQLRPTPPHKTYAGDWADNMRGGIGTAYYSDGARYEGHWARDQRCGYGTMYYVDGSRYDGEWADDMRHGTGILLLANMDRYVGSFVRDKKEGKGQYVFKTRGSIYEGEWVNDQPRFGEFRRLTANEGALTEIDYASLPPLELVDADAVLRESRDAAAVERASIAANQKHE